MERPRSVKPSTGVRGAPHQRRATVGETADDACAPSDLSHDAFHRIVGANAPPVLLGEGVVRESLVSARSDEAVVRSMSRDPYFRQIGDPPARRPVSFV